LSFLAGGVYDSCQHISSIIPATTFFYQHVNPYGTFRLDMNERMQIEEKEAIAW